MPQVPQPAPVPAPAFQPTSGPVLAAPTPSGPEDIAKARAAMEAKLKELAALPPPPPSLPGPAPAPGQKPSRKQTAAQALQSFPPLKGPPPAVSATKQQRLDELLLKYRTDQITPEEYHEQRAKILAEP